MGIGPAAINSLRILCGRSNKESNFYNYTKNKIFCNGQEGGLDLLIIITVCYTVVTRSSQNAVYERIPESGLQFSPPTQKTNKE